MTAALPEPVVNHFGYGAEAPTLEQVYRDGRWRRWLAEDTPLTTKLIERLSRSGADRVTLRSGHKVTDFKVETLVNARIIEPTLF